MTTHSLCFESETRAGAPGGALARTVDVAVDGCRVSVKDDAYSDRVRCDHPDVDDGYALGRSLRAAADLLGRGRVVVLARRSLAGGLLAQGFEQEALLPGFYDGEDDCAVLGLARRREREAPAFADEVAWVDDLLEQDRELREPPDDVVTRLATPADAEDLAGLLGETFAQYPTPSDDPGYVAQQILDGTPFRMVEQDGELCACASADLVTVARTAELTDCATLPEHRGQGYMQRILADLCDDLREMGYPTAFTLARARVPGVNLAFQRLGFVWRGRMKQSCRIGDGLEDMNVFSRPL